jgi:putative phosphoribosyl transferase
VTVRGRSTANPPRSGSIRENSEVNPPHELTGPGATVSSSVPPLRILEDREAAGRQLAERLAALAAERPVVLALPRGGVPVAAEIARRLGAPLDVLIVRKIGAPGNPEYGLGALAEGGVRLLDETRIRDAGLRPIDLESTIARESAELARRAVAYRAERAPIVVAGRTVILVDDGVATGATLEAAIRSVRSREPRRVVVALGVGPPETIARLRRLADAVEVLLEPETFLAVGEWYRVFDQVSDATVRHLLASRAESDERSPVSSPGEGHGSRSRARVRR